MKTRIEMGDFEGESSFDALVDSELHRNHCVVCDVAKALNNVRTSNFND